MALPRNFIHLYQTPEREGFRPQVRNTRAVLKLGIDYDSNVLYKYLKKFGWKYRNIKTHILLSTWIESWAKNKWIKLPYPYHILILTKTNEDVISLMLILLQTVIWACVYTLSDSDDEN